MHSGASLQMVPDLKCVVHDLLLEVVDLKQEMPDLRSGGNSSPRNLTPGSPPPGGEDRGMPPAVN